MMVIFDVLIGMVILFLIGVLMFMLCVILMMGGMLKCFFVSCIGMVLIDLVSVVISDMCFL